MKTQNTSPKQKVIGGVLGTLAVAALLFAGVTQSVSANNGNNGTSLKDKIENRIENLVSRKLDPATDVHMGGNGKISVSNAKVISISGSAITARVSFGAYNMDWTVATDSNTKFSGEKGTVKVLTDIKVGDTVNFSGQINTMATSPTVTAASVRDISLVAAAQHLFEGSIVSIANSTTPATAIVKIGGTDFTVNIPSGISVLNKNWQVVSLGTYQAGNNIRLYGSLQASSTNVIDASVIRNTSI